MTTITKTAIDQDRRLRDAAEQSALNLDRHRWEQCADPAGPMHTQAAYAAAVGVNQQNVSVSVKAWAKALLAANPTASAIDTRAGVNRNGQRKASPDVETAAQIKAKADQDGTTLTTPTPAQHDAAKSRARHSADEADIINALAVATGLTAATVGDIKPDWPSRRADVRRDALALMADGYDWADAVVEAAARTADNITRAKKAAAAEKRRENERKKQHTTQYLYCDGALQDSAKSLRRAVDLSEGVKFNDEEHELLTDSARTVRGLLNLLDMRLNGADVDWDAELAKLGGAS